MPLVVKTEKKNKPHLALTHNELQGGAANQRNVSLLMKSDVEITEEIASLIEKVAGVKVEVNKASYRAIREGLEQAVKKFEDKSRDYPWVYVEDFDDNYVIFSNNDGLFYTTYSIEGKNVIVGDEAISVTRVYSYVADEDKIVLVNDLSVIDDKVTGLILKSIDKVNDNKKLVDIFKSKQLERGKRMDEIQKAVETATNELKVELQKAKEDLQKAQDLIAEYDKKQKEAKDSLRKQSISEVIAEKEKVEEIFKATENLDDSAFEIILKSFSETKELLEKSDLFNREGDRTDIEKEDEVPVHRALLKQKFQKSE